MYVFLPTPWALSCYSLYLQCQVYGQRPKKAGQRNNHQGSSIDATEDDIAVDWGVLRAGKVIVWDAKV